METLNNESIVIYSILNDNNLMEDIGLTGSDFSEKENRVMFENMEKQYEEYGSIELVELIEADSDAHYVEEHKEMIESCGVDDISRYVSDIKEVAKKQAIEDSMKKYTSLGADITSSEAISELSTLVGELEKDSSNKNEFNLDIQNLSNVELETPEFYLEKFLALQKNEINLLSAAGGEGKSFLGILLLSKLQKEYDLNIFAWFSEDTAGFVKHRTNKLKAIYKEEIDCTFDIAGKGHAMGFVEKGKNGNLQASKFFEFFKKQMQKYDVILLDPLIQFMGNIDENNNGEVRFFFNILNTWADEESKTFIIIHHHNKGSNDADGNKTTSVRGASAIIDAVRMHYSLSRKDPTIQTKSKKKNSLQDNKPVMNGFIYCDLVKSNHAEKMLSKVRLFPAKENPTEPIAVPTIIESKQEDLDNQQPAISNINVNEADEIPF